MGYPHPSHPRETPILSRFFGDAGARTLAPGAPETLCVHVALPTSSANAHQGLATTATFQFVAEQTANNP